MHPAFLLPIVASLKPQPSTSPSVPPTPSKAAKQLKVALQTALASGNRRLQTEILTSAIDPRSRIYDEASASLIFSTLVTALKPVHPLHIVVTGSTAALRVQGWLSKLDDPNPSISVSILGMDEQEQSSSLLVLDPPGSGDAILQLRALLKKAHKGSIPVVVHNHPREGALHDMLGFGGSIPYELFCYECAFSLAPFALQVGDGEGVAPRFVLMRQFPHRWALWRYVGEGGGIGTFTSQDVEEGEDGMYQCVGEFDERPSDAMMMSAVREVIG